MDPRLSVAENIPGVRGGDVNVSVQIDEASDAAFASFNVFYDPTVLEIRSTDIRHGSHWPATAGWALFGNVIEPGNARVILFNGQGRATASGPGEIANLQFSIAVDAPDGPVLIDIEPLSANEGGLSWSSSDGSILIPESGALPRVTGVTIGSTQWSSQFIENLTQTGLGSSLGFAVGTDSTQLDPLGWLNLNQITLHFSETVVVGASDLALAAVNVPSYEVVGFEHQIGTRRVTWTLGALIETDKLQIGLGDTVADLGGNQLDGEWLDGSGQAQSGNGVAGGDFLFRFNVLVGDIDQDATIGTSDVETLRGALGSMVGDTAYDAQADTDGDGIVSVFDVGRLRQNLGTQLPAGESDAVSLLGVASAVAVAVSQHGHHAPSTGPPLAGSDLAKIEWLVLAPSSLFADGGPEIQLEIDDRPRLLILD